MPDLRVLTWNSGGEADGRGLALANVVNAINALYAGDVPVQLIAIQEANVGAGGSIAAALANGAPFNVFVQPPGHCREHLPPPAQPFRIAPSKAYLMSWMDTAAGAAAANNLAAVGIPVSLVNLDPANDAGVNNFINGFGMPPFQLAMVRQAAANMRWPVYQAFTYGAVPATVHFFSWHAPLLVNWLNANFSGNALQGPALPEAFLFFQASSFYTNIINNLTANDMVIIAGDLNMTLADIAQPGFFNLFVGASNGLEHVLAYSPSANLAVDQGWSIQADFRPHWIVSARVRW